MAPLTWILSAVLVITLFHQGDATISFPLNLLIGSNGCEHDEFQCNTGTCIHKSRRCNTLLDCPNGDDELNCDDFTIPKAGFNLCQKGEFLCNVGTCIAKSRHCNGERDCPNGDDEKNCEQGKLALFGGSLFSSRYALGCKRGQIQCATGGECVAESDVCDSHHDCSDSSDEYDCGNKCARYPELCLKSHFFFNWF